MARVAGLDVPGIVAAALAIADTDGVDHLSMRRLARELDVTPMSIYHHVRDKEELLTLVLDESLRAIPNPGPDLQPAEALEAWGLAFHRLLVEHPTIAERVSRRRLQGPVATASASAVLTLFERAGVEDDKAVDALMVIVSFVVGASLYRTSRLSEEAREGVRRLPLLHDSFSHGVQNRLITANLDDDVFRAGLRALLSGYLRAR